MNKNSYNSVVVKLDDLSNILRGDLSQMTKVSHSRSSTRENQIVLHYRESEKPNFASILGISVSPAKVDELLAWAYTELEGLTPFNDTLRIINPKQINLNQNMTSNSINQNYETWSLLVLGEMLTRMESTKSLSAINISWINATFTKAAALTAAHNKSKPPSDWNDLIEALEGVTTATENKSYRPLLNEMIPIWNIVSSNIKNCDNHMSLRDPINFTSSFCALLGKAKVLSPSDIRELQTILEMFPLNSNSVEKRLLGFDNIVRKFEKVWIKEKKRKVFWAIVLGLSASFVGRGPSHLNLLDATTSAPDSRFMWAAFIAQYSEKSRLPYMWTKAIRQIARELNGQAQLGWENGYDMGIYELKWLCKLPQNINLDQFRGIRSSNGTVLTELLPGVTFLARTSSTEKGTQNKHKFKEHRNFKLMNETLSNLQIQLEELQSSLRFENQSNRSIARSPQQDLFEEG